MADDRLHLAIDSSLSVSTGKVRSEELGAVVAASPQFYKKQEIFLPFKAFDL